MKAKTTQLKTADFHTLLNAARSALLHLRFINNMVVKENWPVMAQAWDTEEKLREAVEMFKDLSSGQDTPAKPAKKAVFSGMRRDTAMCKGCSEHACHKNEWICDRFPSRVMLYYCGLHDQRACGTKDYNLRKVPFKCPRFGQFAAYEANREEAARER